MARFTITHTKKKRSTTKVLCTNKIGVRYHDNERMSSHADVLIRSAQHPAEPIIIKKTLVIIDDFVCQNIFLFNRDIQSIVVYNDACRYITLN